MPSSSPARRSSSATLTVATLPPPDQATSAPQPVTQHLLGSPEALRRAREASAYRPLPPEAASLLQQMCARASDAEGLRLQAAAAGGGWNALHELESDGGLPAQVLQQRATEAWVGAVPPENLPKLVAMYPEVASLLQVLERLLRGGYSASLDQQRGVLRYFYLALCHGGLPGLRRTALAWVDKLPATLTLVPPRVATTTTTTSVGATAMGGHAGSSDAATSSTPSRAPGPPAIPTRLRPASPAPGPAAKRTRLDGGPPPQPARPAPTLPPGRAQAVPGATSRPTDSTTYVALQQPGLGRIEVPADYVGLLLGNAVPDPATAWYELRLAINGVPLSMRLDHARLLVRTPQREAAPVRAQSPEEAMARAREFRYSAPYPF